MRPKRLCSVCVSCIIWNAQLHTKTKVSRDETYSSGTNVYHADSGNSRHFCSECHQFWRRRLYTKKSVQQKKMDQELFEFPVLNEEKNEVMTLLLNKEDMEKATIGKIIMYLG